MSTVTDVILIVGCLTDQEQAERFSDALKLAGHTEARLKQVDDHAGGNKAVQADIYMGAYNYLDDEAAVSAFYAIKWEERDQVQLLMKAENWDRFKVFVPEIQRAMYPEAERSDAPEGLPEGPDPDCYCKGNPLIFCLKCRPQEPQEGGGDHG